MTINVTAPDGSSVQFPAGTTEQTINQVMTEKFAPPSETTLAGLGKAGLSGVVGGVADLAGLPADVLALTGGEGTKEFQDKYGSQAIRQGVTNQTGFQFHKPQNFGERLLETGGSFLPNMLGGGASLPVKLATRVALPAVASEVAGELTDQNPYAKLTAALAGGVAGLKGERMLAKPSIAAAPSRAQIAGETDALYNHPEVKKLEIDKGYASQWVDDTKKAVDQGSLSGMKAPIPDFEAERAFKAFDRIKGANGNVRVSELDGVRKILGEQAGELGANFKPTPNARAAMVLRGEIDDFLANIKQPNVVAGDAAKASAILQEARANAQVGFKMDKVERLLNEARNVATATHSGGNLENEIYKRVSRLLSNPEKNLKGWTKDEIAALKSVLPGIGQNVLRRGGKILGGGGGLGQLASGSAGAAIAGPIGAIAAPLLGLAMNKAGSAMATKRLNSVSDLLAAAAPSYAPGRAGYLNAMKGPGLLNSLPGPIQTGVYAQLMRPQLVPSDR